MQYFRTEKFDAYQFFVRGARVGCEGPDFHSAWGQCHQGKNMRSQATSVSILRNILFSITFLLTASLAFGASGEAVKTIKSPTDIAIGKECVSCHKDDNPGLVSEWQKSTHSRTSVGCYDCHKANEGEPGAYAHKKYKDKPVFITTVVSPKQCSTCHAREVDQQQALAPCKRRPDPRLARQHHGRSHRRPGGGQCRLPAMPRRHGETRQQQTARRPNPGRIPASAG